MNEYVNIRGVVHHYSGQYDRYGVEICEGDQLYYVFHYTATVYYSDQVYGGHWRASWKANKRHHNQSLEAYLKRFPCEIKA